MKWAHRFRIDAPVEAIYRSGLAPDKWFRFYRAYRGLVSADPNWPEEGSTIAVRYAVLGPWTVQVRQTVVEHERGRRLRMHEEALSGWWIDRPEFQFEPENGATRVTITVDPTSNALPGRLLLVPILWVSGALITPKAMRRFKLMVEASSRNDRE